MTRYIALLILVVPGALAVIGVKLMRDSMFNIVQPLFPWLWLQLLCGFLFFVVGIAFVGGYILYRDRKRHYVANKFRKKP